MGGGVRKGQGSAQSGLGETGPAVRLGRERGLKLKVGGCDWSVGWTCGSGAGGLAGALCRYRASADRQTDRQSVARNVLMNSRSRKPVAVHCNLPKVTSYVS